MTSFIRILAGALRQRAALPVEGDVETGALFHAEASCVAALVDSIIRYMIGYVKFMADDKNRKAYHCAYCGAYIAESGAILTIQGAESHSFVNPAGVLCNFTTFSDCENVMVHEALYLEHSWFPGYGWRFVLCAKCHQHLGWKYDAVQKGVRPRSFFGILVESVDSVTGDGRSS